MELGKLIKSITKVDKHTVRFHINEADATFLSNLSVPFASIVSPAAFKKNGLGGFAKYPVGSGLFKAKSLGKERIQLEAQG